MLAVLTGLLGTLIGLFLGNRLALGLERRKEFNEVANLIYANLENQLIAARSGSFPIAANEFTESSFVPLKPHLTDSKIKKLNISIKKYESAKRECGSCTDGYYKFHSPQLIISAIQELQSYVRRK